MTRRDFQMIADGIAKVRAGVLNRPGLMLDEEKAEIDALDMVSFVLADRLATTNPRFDRARFLRAAGVTE